MKKQISWGKNHEYEGVPQEIRLDIQEQGESFFSKLKHVKKEVEQEIDLHVQIKHMNDKITELDEKINTLIKIIQQNNN